MPNNKKNADAKANRNDEFYTTYDTIQKEINHYEKHFKNQIVLCNCDDPFESNFFRFFIKNFNYLGLKRLICTCYKGSPIAFTIFDYLKDDHEEPLNNSNGYVIDIKEVPVKNGRGITDDDIKRLLSSKKRGVKKLNGDGDFRSEECIRYLKQADIVVTNPPFSKFKEFVPLLEKYNKKFLIIGQMEQIKYKEIFPLILNGKIWVGYLYNETVEFIMPDNYQIVGKGYIDSNGKKHGFVPKICWLTNLDIQKRHEWIPLFKKYKKEEYIKYDNFNAIEIKEIKDIPKDYDGLMGVPISFLKIYNPEQFELIGSTDLPETLPNVKRLGEQWIEKYKSHGGTGHYTANMKSVGITIEGINKIVYSRLIIRNKKI